MANAFPTQPEPTEIPLTDRHWRERWAQELTRANALERELNQTRAARDAARKTCDDLTAHCEGQGNRIASLESELRGVRNRANDDRQELLGINRGHLETIRRLREGGGDEKKGREIAGKLTAYRDLVARCWDIAFADHKPCVDDLREAFRERLENVDIFDDCDVCGGRSFVGDDESDERCAHCVDGRDLR